MTVTVHPDDRILWPLGFFTDKEIRKEMRIGAGNWERTLRGFFF